MPSTAAITQALSQQPTRRNVLGLMSLAAGATVISACSQEDDAATTGTASVDANGRIRLAMLQPPRSGLSPLSDDAFKLSRWATAETLVMLDADGNAVEGLATAWEQADDTTWRLTIREGVSFHDGSELDAQTVVDALNFAAAYPTPPRILDGLDLSAKVDGTDVLVSVSTVDPLLPQRLSSPQLAILSPTAYPDSADGAVDPVGHGTGPFELTAIDGTAAATLERYDGYWGQVAAAAGIDVTFVPDGTARGAALRTGTAEIVEAVPVAQAANIDAALLQEVQMPRTCTLYLNTASGPLVEAGLRSSVAQSLQIDNYVSTIYEGYADPAAGLLGPAITWASEHRSWGSDVYASENGALASGAVMGATATATVPAGTTLKLGSYSDRPELPEIATLIGQDLEAAGFTVEIDIREYAQIEADALDGKFDAFLLSRATMLDSGDPVAYMMSDFSSEGTYSLCFLQDDDVDAALAEANTLTPGAERRAAIIAAEELILAAGAAIPLLHERVLQGESSNVRDVERDPRERALITQNTAVTS